MRIRDLSNYFIVTIAIALLGGDSDHIDREYIAIEANKLAKGKFNWRKFPNRIDLYTVRVALNDANKVKNGQLIIGNNSRGWMLSQNGLRWLITLGKNKDIEDISCDGVIKNIQNSLLSERERLLSTNAYKLFNQDNKSSITKQDFYQFTRTNEYFKTKAKERRYTIIENAIIYHSGLTATWKYLIKRFIKE
jgi:hypothetical protein